jgi:hypothetical protein
MLCQMQECIKGKLIICYTRSFTTNLGNQPHTQSSQTTGSSRGGKKGLDTTGKRAKEHKTHKLPLNSCIKAKEHTKLTLHTWDREKSKKNQVAWPRPHTWRSQIPLPLSFLQKSLILVHHPRKWCTSMSPPGYEATPDINQMFSGPLTCNSKPRARTSKWLNTGVSSKGVKPVSGHFLKSRVSNIHPTLPINTAIHPVRPIKPGTTMGKPLPSH